MLELLHKVLRLEKPYNVSTFENQVLLSHLYHQYLSISFPPSCFSSRNSLTSNCGRLSLCLMTRYSLPSSRLSDILHIHAEDGGCCASSLSLAYALCFIYIAMMSALCDWKTLLRKAHRDTQFNIYLADLLLERGSEDFDSSDICTIIFGVVYESMLNTETSRSGGMLYIEINHKIIAPLLLDDLKVELNEINEMSTEKTRKQELVRVQLFFCRRIVFFNVIRMALLFAKR